MDRGGKEQQRRDRLRDYEARLDAAHRSVAVLAEFARAREARATDRTLEAEFAATDVDGYPEPLPAAIWVALRQADVEAVVDTLVEVAPKQFVIAEHEQLGNGYRLTAVPECRELPDVNRLIAQVAAFVQVPSDALAVVAGWGPDDPRTYAEIAHLLDPRFGPPPFVDPQVPPRPVPLPGPPAQSLRTAAQLTLSRTEFAAMLALTRPQRDVFAALTREANILICADPNAGTGDRSEPT